MNSIHDIDPSEISNISDLKSHITMRSEPSMKSVNYVNTDKQGKKTNDKIGDKSGNNAQCRGEHNTAEILTKNCQKYNTKNTGRNFSKEFLLKEHEDKYDLELRVKPKYRQRISEAKKYRYF